MTGVIIRKELTEFFRDRRFLMIAFILLALLGAASLDGWNRAQADMDVRAAAIASDRDVWINQGENNPHGAAHFSRYAFRSTPPLAAFDPGLFDQAGAAFWMEAHYQNPTTLRRAEDSAVQAPFSSLSPAWIIQIVGTLALAVLLHAGIAGERERGTLKTLSAAGIPARKLSSGKFLATLVCVGVMTFLLMGLSLLPALLSQSLEAQAGRLLWLAVAYSLMLSAFALTVLWLSARSHTVARAFIASAFAWFTLALILPAMSGQLAVSLFPDPDAQSINAAIERDAIAAFREGDAREKAMAALEADIVTNQGGIAFDDLGYSRVALSLQAHEEFANDVYDALYGELYDNHRRQDSVMRYAALFSPVLAVQRLSSALAGTDLTAQISFAEQAEAHRRLMIADLNMDMMVNGGANAYAYRADRTLWEATQEFIPRPPSVTAILSAYRIEWLSLLLWFAVMAVLSVRATQRAMTAEAQ